MYPAGLKEGLYAAETLASYLLYRFNLLDPHSMSSSLLLWFAPLTKRRSGLFDAAPAWRKADARHR
jgi:hypothetical protein